MLFPQERQSDSIDRHKNHKLDVIDDQRTVHPKSERPAEWFTGSVRIDRLVAAPAPPRVQCASVTFEPGARTAWHTHPFGQTLIVTSGCGWAQRECEAVDVIRLGDVVWFAPREKQWHGATPTTGLTHIAVQEHLDGKPVDLVATRHR